MEQTNKLGLLKPSIKDAMNIADLNTNADLIDDKFGLVDNDITVASNRIDTIINRIDNNPDGTNYDGAEVEDIRVGYDGSIYPGLAIEIPKISSVIPKPTRNL